MATEAVNKTNRLDGRLKIEVSDDPARGLLMFRLEGRLDVFTYLSLKETMALYFDRERRPFWLVDLSQVPFVASSGWSVFIAAKARLKRTECTLGLVDPAPAVLRVYQSMGLEAMVKVYANVGQAYQELGLQP